MTSQPGQQTIAIHTLTNTSRNKDNQTMCQLIQHKIRNIFLQKSDKTCDAETIPKLFSKKSKLSISLDQ